MDMDEPPPTLPLALEPPTYLDAARERPYTCSYSNCNAGIVIVIQVLLEVIQVLLL